MCVGKYSLCSRIGSWFESTRSDFHSLIDAGSFLVRSCHAIVLISAMTKPGANTAGQKSDSSVSFVSFLLDMPHCY